LNVGRSESDNEPPNLTHDFFRAVSCFFGDTCMQGDPSRSVGRDNELYSAARTGSKTALGQLLEECRNYLLLIANRELGEGVRAKLGASDLVQETFAEAQRIFDRFEGKSSQEMRAWLVGILEFKIAQATRRFAGTEKRDVRREISLETLSRDEWPQEPGGSALLGTPLSERAAKLAALQAAVERLPPDYRLAIEVRSYAQRPFAEVAAKLGRSTEAARRLWLRAVVRLRNELAAKDHEQRPSGL
jgi:RNA polymerase sigma-70 factor, ECF subfamily